MSRITTDTCILCPNGCELEIHWVKGETGVRVMEVIGHRCPRGVEYGTEEVVAPKRTVTTTVRVIGGIRPLVSVRTASPIPKKKIADCLAELRQTTVQAPVCRGDKILENTARSGVAVVATRSVACRSEVRCNR